MSLDHIDPYPWFLNKTLDLVVNEQIVHARFTSTQWADHWRPLIAKLHDLWQAARPKRFIVAIAGAPGSGKSVLAEQLHWLIEKGALDKDAHSVALPMDGFHYPNDFLVSHTRTLPDGSQIPLSSVKGQPDTIDVNLLRKYLQALIARPEYVNWPGYSRFTHEVIPGKFRVHQSINFIIIEGNYLLLNRGTFAPIPPLFDLRIYVDAPAAIIISNLVERHIRSGKEIEQAKDWVKKIDLPNARVAESSKQNADIIIERESNDEFSAIHYHGQELTASQSPNPNPNPSTHASVPPPTGSSQISNPNPQTPPSHTEPSP